MDYGTFKAQYNIRLNAQQEKAVLDEHRALLMLAVPGSGKTTTLVTKLGYWIFCRGIAPQRIVTMTYTTAAAADMRERFNAIFGEDAGEKLAFRTINGLCASVINKYARDKGAEPFTLVKDNVRHIRQVYREELGDYPSETDIRTAQTLITYAKNMRLSAEELGKLSLDDGKPFAGLYSKYNSLLSENAEMDYDDQMVIARRILLKQPRILDYCRSKYPFVCVDEAQDTSKIQHEIIRILVGGNNLFMVGDEDQSIYGFRAAYPDALMSFEQDYDDAAVLFVEQNYRSTPEIIKCAGRVIANNTKRRAKRMFTQKPSGAAVEFPMYANRSAQYAALAKAARDNGSARTAVLYRNNDSALPLIDILDRQGIAFQCRQTETSFFTNTTVMTLTDVLRFALDQTDTELFWKVWYKLPLYVKKEQVNAAVKAFTRGQSGTLFSALAAACPEKFEQILTVARQLAAIRTDTAGEAVSRAVYQLDLAVYIKKHGGDTEHIYLLTELAKNEPGNVSALLNRLEELKRIQLSGGAADGAFILSTIHSAKGLEYDRVYLIDAVDGILPSVIPDREGLLTPEEAAATAEERRLFYVGMTRARERLTVHRYAGRESRFINEAMNIVPEEPELVRFEAPDKPAIKPPAAKRQASAEDDRRYAAGQYIRHAAYGKGTIINRDGDWITVNFDKCGRKKLSLTVCIKEKIISLSK